MRLSLISFLAVLATSAAAASLGSRASSWDCLNEEVIHNETLETGVVVKGVVCHDNVDTRTEEVPTKREISYICPSSTKCDTTCYAGSGGPNEADCAVIYNTISGYTNDVQASTGQSWIYTYNSCEARWFNQVYHAYDVTLSICPSAFAGTIKYLSGACNGAHSAKGGKCLSEEIYATAPDGCDAPDCAHPTWFIDVIHT